jgi:hypothetical protein
MFSEDAYPFEKYTGMPEYDLYNQESYRVNDEEDLPSLTLSTTMKLDDLPPIPAEHTLDYQLFHP